MPTKTKILIALIPVALISLFVGFQAVRYWWYRGYSNGTRSGIVRKISVKGPPYCKYLSGELTTQINQLAPEIWEFSVDDDSDANPVVVALHDAEKKGERVTLHYRQDLHSLYRCTPSEYFVTKVDK